MWFYDKILFYIKLLFVKEKELYSFLYRFLGFCPGNMRLYRQALCHRSEAANSTEGRSFNNERLEFLGDAVLNAVIADMLYREFRRGREGFLTNTRSKIVQRETLNRSEILAPCACPQLFYGRQRLGGCHRCCVPRPGLRMLPQVH